jgi:hypothetical protein
MLLDGLRDIGGDIALGVAQADEEVHRRLGDSGVAQALLVLERIASIRTGVAANADPLEILQIAVQIPAPSDPQDLQVGFNRRERTHQREQPRTLDIPGQPLI